MVHLAIAHEAYPGLKPLLDFLRVPAQSMPFRLVGSAPVLCPA